MALRYRDPPVVRMKLFRLVAVAIGFVAIGCSQTKATSDAANPLPTPTEAQGELGKTISVMGVDITMMTVDPYTQTPTGFPRLVVAVRSENTTDRMLRNPQVELQCDEAADGGEWYNGSTWEADGLLPAGNVNEGQLYLGFPSKRGAPDYPVPTCTNPQIVMTLTNDATLQQHVITYPVDLTVIQQAIEAPLGPELPLPNSALSDNGTPAQS
jgi:hypothetical protein